MCRSPEYSTLESFVFVKSFKYAVAAGVGLVGTARVSEVLRWGYVAMSTDVLDKSGGKSAVVGVVCTKPDAENHCAHSE